MVVEAGDGLTIHPFGQGQFQQGGQDGRGADSDVQRLGFARGTQARLETHQTGWAVQAVLNFLFAGPQHFDGLAGHGLGNRDGLAGEVLRAFTPKTPTQLHRVHFHIGLGHACCRRRHGQGGFRVLR